MILPAVAGTLLILTVLWEAFESVVLPRRVLRRFRFTRLYYRATWFPWRALGRLIHRPNRREGFLSIFGPFSLLLLFGVWAALLIVGFGFLYYSAAAARPPAFPLQTCMYLSGTTFFTLGIGDVTPHTGVERVMAVTESGLGFGYLALVLSYLPVIYQAFSRREVSIVLLDARAGSPPTAGELLRRNGPDGGEALERLMRDWERWSAEILESHISYPVVSYFRSQHNNESWLGALTAILDSTALIVSSIDSPAARQAKLTFAMCRHTVADLAQIFQRPPRSTRDRLPPAEYDRLRASLSQAGIQLRDTPESREKLKTLRAMYEPYVEALADHLSVALPPWIMAKEIIDNWKTSAWGRISGFGSPLPEGSVHDDHTN